MKQVPIFGKKKIKSSYPNQFMCEERANGVVCNGNFYPFKITAYVGNTPDKPHVAYYVYYINLAYYRTGIAVADRLYLYGYYNGSQQNLAFLFAPESLNATDYLTNQMDIYPRMLMQFGRKLVIGSDHNTFTESQYIIVYAEIDSLPGDKNPIEVVKDEVTSAD